MLEVVAGVDDDGEPVAQEPAPGRATAWRRRRRRRAPRIGARPSLAHRNRSSRLGPDQRRRRPRRRRSSRARARAPRAGLGRLAHDQHGRRRHRIGKADLGHLQRPARQVLLAAPVPQRRHAGRADGEPDGAEPPGAADAVGDDDADVGAEMRVEPLLEAPRAGVGVLRQQQHAPAVVLGSEVRLVDAGIGHHQAVRVATISTLGLARSTSVASPGWPRPGARPCR